MQKRHILNWRILVVAAFIFLLYDASNGFTIMSFLNDSFLLSFFKLTGFITASPSTGFGGGSSSAIDILIGAQSSEGSNTSTATYDIKTSASMVSTLNGTSSSLSLGQGYARMLDIIKFINFTLNSPEIFLNTSNATLTFNYSITALDTLDACSLYGNWTSGWHYNSSDTAPVNRDSNLFTLTLEDGLFIWNIECNDTSNSVIFDTENRTLRVDTIPPSMPDLVSPLGTNTTDNSPILEWNASSDANLDNYTIELSFDSDLSTINQTYSSPITTLTNYTTGLSADLWFWRVTAYDFSGNGNASSISNFSVTATTSSSTRTESSVISGGGGGGGGGKGIERTLSLDLIQIGAVTLFTGEELILPIDLTNNGAISVYDITLDAVATGGGLSLKLSRSRFDVLKPGEKISTDLIIRSTGEDIGVREITLTATSKEPVVADVVKFFVKISDASLGDELLIVEKIVFIKNMIQENLGCTDLEPVIQQVEDALSARDFEKAAGIADNIIQGCRDLISPDKGLIQVLTKPRDIKSLLTLLGELVLFLIVFAMMYDYYKKRKFRARLR